MPLPNKNEDGRQENEADRLSLERTIKFLESRLEEARDAVEKYETALLALRGETYQRGSRIESDITNYLKRRGAWVTRGETEAAITKLGRNVSDVKRSITSLINNGSIAHQRPSTAKDIKDPSVLIRSK